MGVCVCVFSIRMHISAWRLGSFIATNCANSAPFGTLPKFAIPFSLFPFSNLVTHALHWMHCMPHPLGGVLCLQLALIKTELERVEFRLLFVYLKSSKFSLELQTVNFCCSIIKNFLVVLRSVSSTFY